MANTATLIQAVFGTIIIILVLHLLLVSIASKESFAPLKGSDALLPKPLNPDCTFQPFDTAIYDWNSNESEETFSNKELLNYIKNQQGNAPPFKGAPERLVPQNGTSAKEPFDTTNDPKVFYPAAYSEGSIKMSPYIGNNPGRKVTGLAKPSNSYNELQEFEFPVEDTDQSVYFNIEKQKIPRTTKGVPKDRHAEQVSQPIIGTIASDMNVLVADKWSYLNDEITTQGKLVAGNPLSPNINYAPY